MPLQADTDTTRLEEIEKLSIYRWVFYGLAIFLVMVSTGPWIRAVRKERKAQFVESVEWERYQRENRARDMMIAHMQSMPGPVAEQNVQRMRLAQPRTPPPAKPRVVKYGPPWYVVTCYMLSLAGVFGAGSVRQRQLEELEKIRRARLEARSREQQDQVQRELAEKARQEAMERGEPMPEESAPGTFGAAPPRLVAGAPQVAPSMGEGSPAAMPSMAQPAEPASRAFDTAPGQPEYEANAHDTEPPSAPGVNPGPSATV